MPGASGNYKPPAAFEESNCRNIKGIMTCICCWVLASQLASKACNVPLTGIHWRRRGRNMEYDLHRFTPQVRKYSPAKFQGTKLRQTAPKGIASRQRYCSFVVCLCMLDMAHICCACEGCSESGIWVLDFERWPRLWEAYSVGIFGMFVGADLANCFSISKLGIASNKPTQGYGEKCDEI